MPFKLINSASTSPIWNASSMQGSPVSTSAVVAGQVLTYNGTTWQGISATPVQTVSVPSQALDPNTTFSILQPTSYSTNYTLGSPTGTYNTKTIILNGNNNVNILCVPGTINLTPDTPSASLVFNGNQWIRYGVSSTTYNWLVSIQQGSKLVATGYNGASSQGNGVSISGDGSSLAVGGYTDSGNVGVAWIFSATGATGWKQTQKLVGTGYTGTPEQGVSLTLSTDNTTLAVGGINDNGGVGAVWMFANNSGNWGQQGVKLVPSDVSGNASVGVSIALSSNGNISAIGGYTDDSNVGATWIYSRSGTGWSQSGTKIVGTGYSGSSYQGCSVALSNDGSTLAIGGYGDDSNIGAVWIYYGTGLNYTYQAKLVGSDGVGSSSQGASVALSSDGNTVAFGGISDDSGVGAVWVFNRQGTVWTQGNKLVGSGYVGASQQGYSLSMSGDGNTLCVGGAYDNSALGAMWVYTRTGINWTQQGSKLVGTGYSGGAPGANVFQGVSSSLTTSGNKLVVGGSGDNSSVGAVWTFI